MARTCEVIKLTDMLITEAEGSAAVEAMKKGVKQNSENSNPINL